MRFFGKLSRLKGPAVPTVSDFAVAIDTIEAQVLAHHRLLGLVMAHVLALTPPEHRRNLVNLLYSGIKHPDANPHQHGLSGKPFSEIGREADELSNNLIDAIAVGATPLNGNAPPGT